MLTARKIHVSITPILIDAWKFGSVLTQRLKRHKVCGLPAVSKFMRPAKAKHWDQAAVAYTLHSTG